MGFPPRKLFEIARSEAKRNYGMTLEATRAGISAGSRARSRVVKIEEILLQRRSHTRNQKPTEPPTRPLQRQ